MKFLFRFKLKAIRDLLYERNIYETTLKKMPVFTQSFNRLTGKKDWILQEEDYDYIQEVARSSYADMLHDEERNDKYYEGIKSAVQFLKQQGKEVHVLDIGTGTGLLSMMAATCEVDSVTACEGFSPMADCARKILEKNGFHDKIRLISKRSTEIECGEGKDMPRKANLLVTEVFDTELIGEGAIETFIHAKDNLLTEDAVIVPCEARVYAQVVSSEILSRFNVIKPVQWEDDSKILKVPKSISKCPGAAAVHDLQMSEISKEWFTELSEPMEVFKFNWSNRVRLFKNETNYLNFTSRNNGNSDAVFMWWDITMDPQKNIILSCAPHWQHPLTRGNANSSSKDIPWRDHWMQALYYLPSSLSLERGDDLQLFACHDEYSLWFDLERRFSDEIALEERPVCECSLHATSSRTRIGRLNDPKVRTFFKRILPKYISPQTVCLCLGDFSLIGLMAAKLGAFHVYLYEENSAKRMLLKEFIEENDLSSQVTLLLQNPSELTLQDFIEPINLVLGEPHYELSLLPWDSLRYWYHIHSVKHLLRSNVVYLPRRVSIKALPVHFRDLRKIRAPLGHCSNFDVSDFDRLIDRASTVSDANVEPQPLWEYPATAVAYPKTLLSLDLTKCVYSEKQNTSLAVEVPEPVANGLALWADWHFDGDDEEDILSTGPAAEIVLGEQITWDMYVRQGVHLFRDLYSNLDCVKANVSFNADDGDFDFKFEFQTNQPTR